MEVQVKNLKWSSAEHISIDMMCKFPHLSDFVPFTASPNDPELYGKELFRMASAGEFGTIEEFGG